MSDKSSDIHLGENSPQHIAYKLMDKIRMNEGKQFERNYILDLYAECLDAALGRRLYDR